MAEVILTEFRADTTQFTAAIDKAEGAVVDLNAAEKDASKSTTQLTQQLGGASGKAAAHGAAMKGVTKESKTASEATRKVARSIDDLKRKLDAATKHRKTLVDPKEIAKANDSIRHLRDEIKQLEDSTISASGGVTSIGDAAKDAATQAVPSVGGIGDSFLKLLGPVGIVVGAIAGAFLAVFKNTDAGATAIEGLQRSVGFTFDRITGYVKRFGESLADAFGGADGPAAGFIEKLGQINDKFLNIITVGAAGAIKRGLEGDLEAGQLVATQLDDLADKQLVVNETTAKNEIVIRKNLAALRDITKPLEERLRLADEITAVEKVNLQIQRDQLKEQLKVALFEANVQASRKQEIDDKLKAQISGIRTQIFDLEAESVSLTERVAARRAGIVEEEENRKAAARARTVAEEEKVAAASLRAAEKRKAADEKAAAAEKKHIDDTLAAQKAVQAVETGLTTSQLDELGKRDAAVRASFEKQIETARAAYAELSKLAAPEDREAIEQRQADTILALNKALQEELTRLREQDLEGVRSYAKTKEEVQIDAINKEFDAQKKATEDIIADETERTNILKTIEANRQLALADIRTAADNERLAQQTASQSAELNALGGFAEATGALLAGMATGQLDAAKNFAKASLSIALDAVDAMVPIWVAQATGASLAQPDSVATFGASGLARAAVLTALIKGVIAGLRGTLGFADGGEVTKSSGPRVRRSNGDNVLATLQDKEIVLSRASRARAEHVFGRGVWGELGVPGFGGSIDWSAALARVSAASAARDGGSTSVIVRPNDDRRIVGAIGGIGSVREQRRQTELLEELVRARGRNPRSRWT